VAGDIIKQLAMQKPDGFKGSFFRPNLRITAHRKGGEGPNKRETRKDILGIIARHRGDSGIVYCLSRRSVDSMTEWLRSRGVKALAYHAGLDDATRARHQDAFARDEADVIVATVAFGMGIDKSNVRFVIHRDMPKSVEAWYQEIGRAGRDGLDSDCVLFYSWADVIGYEAFLGEMDDDEVRAETKRKTVEMFRLADRSVCRHQTLVRYFDEEMSACGTSCDICRGETIEALVANTRGFGKVAAGKRSRGAADEGTSIDLEMDHDLFERLRAVRKRLADDEGVPAYIVFSDAVLRQMAQHIPQTKVEMLLLSGVGPVKLERYGEAFLEALRGED
jgi:ATP-dependent DNA helicase RecQ